MTPPRHWRKYALFTALLTVVGLAALILWPQGDKGAKAPVDSITGLAERITDEPDLIEKLTVDPNTATILVEEKDVPDYSVAVPNIGDDEGQGRIVGLAREAGIEVSAEPLSLGQESFLSKFARMLPSIVIVIAVILLLTMAMPRGLSSKSKESKSTIRFEDVAGVDEAIEELRDVRSFLADSSRFDRLGAKAPKGVLLYGPPGGGKTLLAKAIATEAGVPFYAYSGSEFVEMFAGLGARRVRQAFKEAKKTAPSIIFIDELDAVGGHRSRGGDGGTREADQTLIELLRQMDGFEVSSSPVIVIGATNRLDALDPALTRPGRFDRHIAIEPPDRGGRLEILNVHARDKRLGESADLGRLATQTAGMTGAELALILNEAALAAARREGDAIEAVDVDDAYFRVVAGVARQHRTLNPEERRRVAYHETGHAIVREHLEGPHKVHKISIVPRGLSGGQTLVVSEDDVFLHSEEDLRAQVALLLAGRAAEEISFGAPSSGAADDLDKATSLAEKMVSKLGMGDALGLAVIRSGEEVSPELQHRLEEETRAILATEHDRARDILLERADALERISAALLDEETIDRDRFLELLLEPEQA